MRQDLLLGGVSDTVSMPYGNDRTETPESRGPIRFSKVEAGTPNYLDTSGTPLCTVRFTGRPSFRQIILPTDPLLPLTDLEVRNGIAYISADSATAADSDVLVVDFKDFDSVQVRSAIDTGPGLRSIALARNRIYAAAASTFAQLHIILINSLDDLVLDNRIKVGTSSAPFGSSIFYSGEKIYLGTEKWLGQELSIFDVGEPSEPAYLDGYEVGSKINDIHVKDDLAYVAASDEEQLRILNITNSPRLVDSLSPSGWERQEGKVVSVFENEYFFGRTAGGFNIRNDHELFNNSSSIDVPGGVYGIVADRLRIYLISRDIGNEFQIWNRDLSTSTKEKFSLPVAPQALTCDGSKLYALAETAPVIYEISFE